MLAKRAILLALNDAYLALSDIDGLLTMNVDQSRTGNAPFKARFANLRQLCGRRALGRAGIACTLHKHFWQVHFQMRSIEVNAVISSWRITLIHLQQAKTRASLKLCEIHVMRLVENSASMARSDGTARSSVITELH